MMAYSKNTKIISMNGGFVVNAVCDSCNTVIPAEAGLKERLETALSETKLQEYKVTEEKGTPVSYTHLDVYKRQRSTRLVYAEKRRIYEVTPIPTTRKKTNIQKIRRCFFVDLFSFLCLFFISCLPRCDDTVNLTVQ